MLFAAHESFHIRQGWLRKGLRAIEHDPYIFSREDSPDVLGVGRNMVSAIRYWLQATGLARAAIETTDGKRTSLFTQTPFARLLMQNDPFLEDEGTLWFLHSQLATNFEQGTTWSWFFNRFGVRHFTQDIFLGHLQRFVEAEAKRKIAPRSLEKDFRCFVRTYTRTMEKVGHTSPEETFDCPLSSLHLLEYLPRTKSYRILSPDEGSLPTLAVAYLLVRMRSQTPLMNKEVSFRDALYSEGSPGRILNLDPESLYSYLMRLSEDENKVLSFSPTAGLNLVTLHYDDPDKVMELYYKALGSDN